MIIWKYRIYVKYISVSSSGLVSFLGLESVQPSNHLIFVWLVKVHFYSEYFIFIVSIFITAFIFCCVLVCTWTWSRLWSSLAKYINSSFVIFETNTKLAVTIEQELLLLEIYAPKFEFNQNKSHQFSIHFAMTSVMSCVRSLDS